MKKEYLGMSILKKNKNSAVDTVEEKIDNRSKEILEEVTTRGPIEKDIQNAEDVKEDVEKTNENDCDKAKLNMKSEYSKTPKFKAWYDKRYIKPKKELREMYERLAAILGEDGVIEFIKNVIFTLDRFDIYGSIDAYRLFVMPMYNIAQPYRSDLATLCKMCFLYTVNSWTTHISKSFVYDMISYNNKSFEDIAFGMFSNDYPDTYKGYMMGDNIGSFPGKNLNEIRSRQIYHIEYNFAIDHVYLLSPAVTFNPRANGAEYDVNMKIGGDNYEEIVMNFNEVEKIKDKVSHRPNATDGTVTRTTIANN